MVSLEVYDNKNKPKILLQNTENDSDSESESDSKEQGYSLQLGDIVRVKSPLNEKLHDKSFFIDYIDSSKMYGINIQDPTDRQRISIEGHTLGDGDIEDVVVVSKNPLVTATRPRARYIDIIGLKKGQCVSITFGGELPSILTGVITNIEEDMIELTTVDKDHLYIDFAFQGLPEDLLIESIKIKPVPCGFRVEKDPVIKEPDTPEEDALEEDTPEQETVPPEEETSVRDMEEPTKDVLFGDELQSLFDYYEEQSLRNPSIQTQTNEMLFQWIQSTPAKERTCSFLNELHLLLERYCQLRNQFSKRDAYGTIQGFLKKGDNYRPLSDYYLHMGDKIDPLRWIVPVVQDDKKVYMNTHSITGSGTFHEYDNDKSVIVRLEPADTFQFSQALSKAPYYEQVGNHHQSPYLSVLQEYLTPFLASNRETELAKVCLQQQSMNVLVANNDPLLSSNAIAFHEYDTPSLHPSPEMIRKVADRVITELANVPFYTQTCIPGDKIQTHTVTTGDVLHIHGILQLPKEQISLSQLFLPTSSIFEKAVLNADAFVPLWQTFVSLRQRKLSLDTQIVLQEPVPFHNAESAVLCRNGRSLASFVYADFAKNISPTCLEVVQTCKDMVEGTYSLQAALQRLYPFYVCIEDIHVAAYDVLQRQILERRALYDRVYKRRFQEFAQLAKMSNKSKQMNAKNRAKHSITTLLGNLSLRTTVFENDYELLNDMAADVTNAELLRQMTLVDGTRMLTTAVAVENIRFVFPENVFDLLEKEQEKTETQLEKESKEESPCNKKIIVAKFYSSRRKLEEDNGKDILYFDKKYDTTNYGLLEEQYKEQILDLSPEDLEAHIQHDLMTKNLLSEGEALYMAKTLMDGNKQVHDGHYAILYVPASDILDEKKHKSSEYFVRKNNLWVKDEEVTQKDITEPSLLCDLQDKCVSAKKLGEDACEEEKIHQLYLKSKALGDILDEFDRNYKESEEQMKRRVNNRFEYYNQQFPLLRKVEAHGVLKYNVAKQEVAKEADEGTQAYVPVRSPFATLLQNILSMRDDTRRFFSLQQFVLRYTRPALLDSGVNRVNELETVHWLYCKETDVRLVPTFLSNLCNAFLAGSTTYQKEVVIACQTVGQKSDDLRSWVDEHSGYMIAPVEPWKREEEVIRNVVSQCTNEECSFFEDRQRLERQWRDEIEDSANTSQYVLDAVDVMDRTITSLAAAMEIDMSKDKLFLWLNALALNKQLQSSEESFHKGLFFTTLALFLVAAQSRVPAIKTKKVLESCKMSFEGFPYTESENDDEGIQFVSCMAMSLAGPTKPWKYLHGMDATQVNKEIKRILHEALGRLGEKINRRYRARYAHDARQANMRSSSPSWDAFLPPLRDFTVAPLKIPSEEFKNAFYHNMTTGSRQQLQDICVLQSKQIRYALAVIQEIHKEVTDDGVFRKTEAILLDNAIVAKLGKLLHDADYYAEASLLLSVVDTKLYFPRITSAFSEDTVYRGFICFCRYNRPCPVPKVLEPVCTLQKPSVSFEEPISVIMEKIKGEGKTFTNLQFQQLLQIVGERGEVTVSMHPPEDSYEELFDNLLRRLPDIEIPSNLRTMLLDKEVEGEQRELKEQTEKCRKEVLTFIEMYLDNQRRVDIELCRRVLNNQVPEHSAPEEARRYKNVMEQWFSLNAAGEIGEALSKARRKYEPFVSLAKCVSLVRTDALALLRYMLLQCFCASLAECKQTRSIDTKATLASLFVQSTRELERACGREGKTIEQLEADMSQRMELQYDAWTEEEQEVKRELCQIWNPFCSPIDKDNNELE